MDVRLVEPFINSTAQIIKDMTGIEVTEDGDQHPEKSDLILYGVASVITFVGKIKGRFTIDFEPGLAKVIIEYLMDEEKPNIQDRLMLGCISEINNIIAGDANTLLNNRYGLGLRLAPPIVFSGKNIVLAASKLESVTASFKTAYGSFKLNVAFEGGLAS